MSRQPSNKAENISAPIGIIGGTFDPIHLGHLRCAIELKRKLNLQQVRFIPCKHPVHKEQTYSSAGQRCRMIELALSDEPDLILDTRELDRDSASYMVETLESIRAEEGNAQPICLILGMDAFMALASWHRWRELIELAHFVVMQRPGFQSTGQFKWQTALRELLQPRVIDDSKKLALQPAGYVFFATNPLLDISATEIRRLIQQGESPNKLLPESVLNYIIRERLYGFTKSLQ